MFLLLISILIVISILYIKLKYFTLYGPIPGQSPTIFFGNLIETGLLNGRYLGEITKEFQDKYGDVFQIWLGHLHVKVVCHPDDVQHIFTHRHIYEQGDLHVTQHRIVFNNALICNIGPKYKRHAAVVLPLFRRGKIVSNYDLINDCTDKLLDQWRLKSSSDSNYIHENIVDQCQNLSLAIFGFIGFDYDLQTLEDFNMNNKCSLTKAITDFLEIFIITTRLPNFISKIYLKLNSRYKHSRMIIETYLNQIIEFEQNKTLEQISERKRTSLIASLITSLQKNEQIEAMKSEHEKKGLSRDEIIHELLLFLVAGSETSGTALAWFIFFMSKHSRVQMKLKAELNEFKRIHMTNEQIESLSYLDCVLKEVFRFFPPAACTTRTVLEDNRLPHSGFQLNKGDEIYIPFYNLTRDTRFWKIDPNLFYPERFLNEDKIHHPYLSIPFGAGHRQCIGQDLARFELKTIIIRLMQNVTFIDGGENINAGGSIQKLTNIPKQIGINIKFD